jgi:hypothetical protein
VKTNGAAFAFPIAEQIMPKERSGATKAKLLRNLTFCRSVIMIWNGLLKQV